MRSNRIQSDLLSDNRTYIWYKSRFLCADVFAGLGHLLY